MTSYLSRVLTSVWTSESETDKMRKTNETVAEMSATTRELEVQRAFLRQRAAQLQQEARDADEAGDEQLKMTRVREWQEVHAQMEDLDSLASNQRVVQSTMETAAMNARVFSSQRDAAAALNRVSEQLKPHEVDKTVTQLEASMDNAHAATSVLRKPLRLGHPGLRNARKQDVDSVMASWGKKTTTLPDVVKGSSGLNNNNNVEAEPMKRVQTEKKI
jgi:hypothetical protein